ncbi:CLUMA_CG018458, isoform A [Clunio marinus]|uniref:CLUMA_CG018458, isoform A n=1 Tax=Clunio marinus TaxID=568069 RepID=A0A1J1J1K3_9DIPT|nr:CLUMA_CG018458, isoform A [Clunio marinus]
MLLFAACYVDAYVYVSDRQSVNVGQYNSTQDENSSLRKERRCNVNDDDDDDLKENTEEKK